MATHEHTTDATTLPQEDRSSHTVPEATQFDFWLGEWDLTWSNGGHGTNSIQAILDGKVILETFNADPADAFQGMSFSVYNPLLGKWQQTWVDNQGTYLDLVGGYQEGKMILERTDNGGEKSILQRMIFSNITDTHLDWSWERSQDYGTTWESLWQIHYQRKLSANP
ncbi:MAG TPA: hypothetical protein VKU38_23730 [Ktedonobacteraceae bacterium]|nr:hypothetical protein [Ktedonobacteraceae bacterium]